MYNQQAAYGNGYPSNYGELTDEPFNFAAAFEELKQQKQEYVRQQRRASLLMPPLEPDQFNLEEQFKQYFSKVWGPWRLPDNQGFYQNGYEQNPWNANGYDPYSYSQFFDPKEPFTESFLKECILLQWRLEDPDQKGVFYDKAPIIWYTKSSESNQQRSAGRSLQVCLLGLDPSLLFEASFKAEIKLKTEEDNELKGEESHHSLELMERQGVGKSRKEMKPYIFVTEGDLTGQVEQTAEAEPATPSKKRKYQSKRSRIESTHSVGTSKTAPKVNALNIECYCDEHPKALQNRQEQDPIPMNFFSDREMRGCKREYDDNECIQHCISANFFNIGISRANRENKMKDKGLKSVIKVKVTLIFKNGKDFVTEVETNPFMVSPGKEKDKSSDLFLEFAARILTEHLDVPTPEVTSEKGMTRTPAVKTEDIFKRCIKWKEMREFLKMSFRAQKLEIRELDLQELLLIQCKLFLQSGSTVQERNSLLSYLQRDDEMISFNRLRDATGMVSVIDMKTPINQSLWKWMTNAYAAIVNPRANGPIEKMNRKNEKEQRKMVDFFNHRYITMTSFKYGQGLYRQSAKYQKCENCMSCTVCTKRYKCDKCKTCQRRPLPENGTRIMMFRFDDDNSNLFCTYYTNNKNYNDLPLQSHTKFSDVLNTLGGFWIFMNYPFPSRYDYIIQLTRKDHLNKDQPPNSESSSLIQSPQPFMDVEVQPYSYNQGELGNCSNRVQCFGDSYTPQGSVLYGRSNMAFENDNYGNGSHVGNFGNSLSDIISRSTAVKAESALSEQSEEMQDSMKWGPPDKKSIEKHGYSAKRIFGRTFFSERQTNTVEEYVPNEREVYAKTGQPIIKPTMEMANHNGCDIDNITVAMSAMMGLT